MENLDNEIENIRNIVEVCNSLKGSFLEATNYLEIESKFYERDFSVGLIGSTGSVSRSIINHLLGNYKNAKINLVSTKYNLLKNDYALDELIGIVKSGDLEVDFIELKERINIFKSINSTIKESTGIKRFLDSNFILMCARNTKESFKTHVERNDEYKFNKDFVVETAKKLNKYEKGIILNITNPIEPTSELIAKYSNIPRNRIGGITSTDSIRLRRSILNVLNRKYPEEDFRENDIREVYVLGEHGPSMVQLLSLIKIKDEQFLKNFYYNKNIRSEIKKGLVSTPNIIQRSPIKNIKYPTIATIETIHNLLKNEVVPISSYDGDCFITVPTKSTNLEGKIDNILLPQLDFLTKISDQERKRFYFSKSEILKNLYELDLISENKFFEVLKRMNKNKQISKLRRGFLLEKYMKEAIKFY